MAWRSGFTRYRAPPIDVDFTILLPRGQLLPFYRLVENLGYTVPAPQLGGVRGLPVVKIQIFVGESAIDVDIFLAETPFQHELLRRRQLHQAEGLEAWFVTPEDLTILKLLAGRPKDLVDVADVLFIQGQLDEVYLKRWASELGISAALEEALRLRNDSV